ncbi:MAG TPA: hypothetical protein PK156_02440 [Polyangium sp.]|nr:hypothetical protein [Polyangium sp.]
MLSTATRVFFNRVKWGVVGIVGAMAVAAGCTEAPKPNNSTGGQGGGGFGGEGGSGGSSTPAVEWTEFKESPDTQKVYVSSSDGDDANDGSVPEKAVKTIAKGISLLRDGMPDWMLLKRGNVCLESLGEWTKSGRSETEPMLVSSYGDELTRPILKTGAKIGISTTTGPLQHIAFVGFHLYAHTRDPDAQFMSATGAPGIQWLAPSLDILFEDLLIESYSSGNLYLKANMANIRVRRSILVDSYNTSGESQGLYAESIKGLLIEENVFDHNGWNTTANLMSMANPTISNHNLYVQSNCDEVTIRGNLSTRSSSHGVQARAGGEVSGNLVLDNPVGISFGLVSDTWDPKIGGIVGTVQGNFIADSGDVDAINTGGIGLQIGNIQSATIEDNILAHDASASTASIALDIRRKTNPLVADEKVQNLMIRNNIVYDWRGGIRFGTSALMAVSIQNNDVQQPVRASEVVNYYGTSYSVETTYAGNHWFSIANPGSWFTIGANSQAFDQWVMTSSEQGATNTAVTYMDTARRLAEYHQSLGKTATFDAYMAEVRQQSQKNWRVEYTTKAALAYLRQGFGK